MLVKSRYRGDTSSLQKKLMISENNHQKKLQMKMNNQGGLFKSYKYAQYKNVRGSKV